mgnify:FL=1
MQIDLSTIENVEDLRSVPPGEYLCRVVEVRETRSPAGHLRWGLRWEVDRGEWQGRTACWDSLHWSERGMPRAKFVLQILGFPVSGQLDLQPPQLMGLKALVLVQPEEREDPTSGIRRLMNRVPFTGYAPAPVEPEH